MLRPSKARVRKPFRSSPPSPLSTVTPSSRDMMANTFVPIRAKWFSSGQWIYAPQSTYDIKALNPTEEPPTSLKVLTWNVDFAALKADQRLKAALDYLQFKAFPDYEGGQPPPCLILLQEIALWAFDVLLEHPWVREYFIVVPGSPRTGWPKDGTYGTVTLVARSVPLVGSMCLHFKESKMGRNALVTDVALGGGAGEARWRVLRVINTHLESLLEGTARRVVQMGVIAELLREERSRGEEGGSTLVGGLVCGDMNAIAPSDQMLAERNGLVDAWKHARREGEDGDGATWGYQPRNRYPPGRLDRILHTKSDAFDVRDVRRVAVMLKMVEGNWISDHNALMCEVEAQPC
ncbi:Endonuclease/exonuclease/phosphatase [Russula earlei]|uniref:Endonuclease/exonuclease/phosphatase n=1 Tax=Russula earlei TaxID=71964 RepID=A0ACC0U2N2_9AGAM|nr:Endonuclease/exonuclease/phosphatase [Russula earlei]